MESVVMGILFLVLVNLIWQNVEDEKGTSDS